VTDRQTDSDSTEWPRTCDRQTDRQ